MSIASAQTATKTPRKWRAESINTGLRPILIDGDVLAYLAATLTSTRVDWDGDGNYHECADRNAAVKTAKHVIEKLQLDLWGKHDPGDERLTAIICLSDPDRTYFRHTLFPRYKAGRTHGTPPSSLEYVRDYYRSGVDFPCVWEEGLEADDIIGILASRQPEEFPPKIVSNDKDFKQLWGYHYNPFTETGTAISKTVADAFFWKQVVTGDSTDGVPGAKGIGPVKADKIFDQYSAFLREAGEPVSDVSLVWQGACLAAYGGNVEEATLNWELIRLVRWDEWKDGRVSRACDWSKVLGKCERFLAAKTKEKK